MEIKIPGVRKLRERIDRGNPLWAATPKARLTIIMNNLLKAPSQHATQSGMMTKGSSQEWKTETSMCDRSGQAVVTSWRKTREPHQVSFMRRPSTMEQRNPL